jgi:hypothetical protein
MLVVHARRGHVTGGENPANPDHPQIVVDTQAAQPIRRDG